MKQLLSPIFLLLCSAVAFAQDTTVQQRLNVHFQTTYIYQYKPAFSASYSGPNSLLTKEEKENSVTATLFLGARLWKGAELYVNPEIAGGSGLSGAFGLAASTNGETFRVGDPAPTLYLARGYLQQTFNLSDDRTFVDDAANQLSVSYPKKFLRFYIGKFSIGDLFDNNVYSNSPRTQFMNWALMNNAAWDYAANTRGYTYAFAAQLQMDKWSYKLSMATLPKIANGQELNRNIGQVYSLNAEIDKTYQLRNRQGHVRLLGYYNNANMGSYRQAINNTIYTDTPDVVATRKNGRTKVGFGINADQEINDMLGIFGRIGWNDGQNETWCFTEADRTFSLGISLDGKKWKRQNDNLGVAIVVNGLSSVHREYLADGGLGFQLGDGKLNYGHETAAEVYYSFRPAKALAIWLTGDYQFVLNPGYNKDRGPVNVFSFRLHIEI